MSEAAVAELRRRKHRDAKPFAVMCARPGDGAQAGGAERRQASGSSLAGRPDRAGDGEHKRDSDEIAASSPGNHRLGVMLPYTPMHHLLFAELVRARPTALVMTSANLTDEPLVKDNDEAIERLAGIADAILLHERDIERSIDDSVVIDMGEDEKAAADPPGAGLCAAGACRPAQARIAGSNRNANRACASAASSRTPSPSCAAMR